MNNNKDGQPIILEDDGYCFVCGKNNLQGLRLNWVTEGNKTTSVFTPEKKFQGYVDILHGGIISTLLDEAMTRLVWQKFGKAVTAEMNIRFMNPGKIGEKLIVTGEIIEQKKNIVYTQGSINTEQGTLIAKATGKSVLI